ncbi:MAG: glyoxalase [Blastocatellia bacterium]|nr:glyoxalase [Blastocatellia bacterium]
MKPTVRELKVYVPAKDFDLSKKFYAALGFELTEAWGGNFDGRLGPTIFRLQNYYVEDWANNLMLQFEVEDARAWYDHVKPIIDSGEYAPARIMEPSMHDGALITHVTDPSGVLLIFIQ